MWWRLCGLAVSRGGGDGLGAWLPMTGLGGGAAPRGVAAARGSPRHIVGSEQRLVDLPRLVTGERRPVAMTACAGPPNILG